MVVTPASAEPENFTGNGSLCTLLVIVCVAWFWPPAATSRFGSAADMVSGGTTCTYRSAVLIWCPAVLLKLTCTG